MKKFVKEVINGVLLFAAAMLFIYGASVAWHHGAPPYQVVLNVEAQ